MDLKQIETLISLGDIEGSVTSLTPVVENTPYAQEVLLLDSRYNRMRSDTRKGVVSGEEARIEMNKITAALTEIVNYLKKKQGNDKSTLANSINVNGHNNQIYVGVHDSTINHTTQNHSGSGDNVAGNKIVGK
jgi:Effector-associated domain 11